MRRDGTLGKRHKHGNRRHNPASGFHFTADRDRLGMFRKATNLDLDVANSSIGSKHRIQINPQDVDIEQLSTDVMIVGATSEMTLFAIKGQHGRMTDNFQCFADFEKTLADDLNGTTTALRPTAKDQYDASAKTFKAHCLTVLLSD